jgi:UDP-3-O-[3-hydroxymyristoyl] glucosamine N-acyltransferase
MTEEGDFPMPSILELATRFDLSFAGDPKQVISGVCGISDDRAGHLSFVSGSAQIGPAAVSRISAFITLPDQPVPGKISLFHSHPEYMIARVATAFAPEQMHGLAGVHPTAVIADTAVLGEGVAVGAHAVIGDNVVVGAGTRIFPNVVVMDRCRIGRDCILYPQCTLREDSILGDRVILQPGVVIGGDGYGFVLHEGTHVKIPQLGCVVLEDDVEVGANSAIDRARFSETRVGRGTKLDNLVMLAHNVVTGENCLLAGQVGIAGSSRLGNRVTFAGQVGVVGHVSVADDVVVLGKGGVTKDIVEAGVYAGMPAKPARLWRRAIARLYSGLRQERENGAGGSR